MCSRVPSCAVGRLVWCLATVAVPGASWAQDRFEVPADCGSPEELDQAWTQLVARPSAQARPSVELTSHPAGFRLRVATAEDPRELSAPDCRALFRAAVLIVAVAMAEDGEQAARLSQVSAASTEAEKESSAPALAPAAIPADPKQPSARERSAPRTTRRAVPRRSPRAPWSFAAELAAGVVVGLVPDLNAGVSLALGAQRGAWGIKAGAHYVLPRRRLNLAEQGVRVDAGGPRLLATFGPNPAWALALGFEASAVRGQGSANLIGPRSDSIWLWGPRVEGHWRPWRGGRADFDLGLACTYFVDRARFRFDDGALVYATSHVVGEAFLGVRWRIP